MKIPHSGQKLFNKIHFLLTFSLAKTYISVWIVFLLLLRYWPTTFKNKSNQAQWAGDLKVSFSKCGY